MAGRARGVDKLTLDQDGAQLFPKAALSLLPTLERLFDPTGKTAGRRMHACDGLPDIAQSDVRIRAAMSARSPQRWRLVRAIAFDKSDRNNWALGWHQDRTICVEQKCETAGFGPWTVKQGLDHVEPPFSLLENMLTLRLHFDTVDINNAPLLIARGSHQIGKIPENAVDKVLEKHPSFACLAEPGDVWFYATPILHASQRATPGKRRRVLQLDYSTDELPKPLRWKF